jgi:hypothetical protein
VRKVCFVLILLVVGYLTPAQAPQSLNYQAVARNVDGSIASAQRVSVRFSVLTGSATGTMNYQELHQALTNNFGLFTLAIGRGSAVFGSFSAIDWASGSKFLKVEIAVGGGNSYQLQGTTQLLSVPYALYAEKSGTAGAQGPAGAVGPPGSQGPTGPQGPPGPQGSTGPVGPQGFTGATGPAGMQGPTGLTGAQGIPGAIGPTGPQGISGKNGNTILNGLVNPTTAGVDGDFFLNTNTMELFGPKNNGIWGAGVSVKGPTGLPGSKSLIDLENFVSNASCALGGVIVKSGVDQNGNNVLDATEVDNTKQICFSQSSSLDKVVIIPIFSSTNIGWSSNVVGNIARFNKHNYPGVDSITLVGNPYVSANTSGIIELYNITDNVVINNSTIVVNNVSSGSLPPPVKETGNLFNALPDYTTTLGIKVSTTGSGACFPYTVCLYLYRR